MRSNQISQTAAFISIKFYGLTLTEPYRSIFDNEIIAFYSNLVKTLPMPFKSYHSALQKKWLRKFFVFWEELLLPGDLMHILARKYFITRMVQELKKGENYEQLIVLGAGFDHLAVLFSCKGMSTFELDTPLMADLKKEFIDDHAYNNSNLTITPAYFSEDRLSDILKTIPGLNPGKKTVVVAEGFFDYITPGQTEEILKDLTGFFKNKVSLISTVFALEELSFLKAFVFKSSVRMVGEKLLLFFTCPQFEQLLNKNGFRVTKTLNTDQMITEFLQPFNIDHPILDGFHVLEAVIRS